MASSSDSNKADNVMDHVRTLVQTIVNRQITHRMTEISGAVQSLSSTVREIGTEVQKKQPSEPLAKLTDTIAGRTDAIAQYLEHTPPERMLSDLREYSGRQPAVAALAAIAVGYGAARVVKTATSQSAG